MRMQTNDNTTSVADGVLIERLRRGDERAMQAVFDRHYAMLCRFAMRIVRSRSMAEEVVDDVMFGLWQQRGRIDGGVPLRAWLVRSVRNRSLNALRAKARRPERLCLSGITDAEHLDFLDTLFADPRHPLGTLIEKELAGELSRCIEALPPECRRVFRMVRMEAMTYEQAARKLGISVNTVKYHMKNALSVLGRRFGPYLDIVVLLWLMQV